MHSRNFLITIKFQKKIKINHLIKFFSTKEQPSDAKEKTIKFKYLYLCDNKEVDVMASEGESLLEIAKTYDIDLEGACDASLACSTCHIILDSNLYERQPNATEEEEDLLDLAFGLTSTSRLGCQVKVTKDFNGTIVKIPAATRNMYVDGKKPAKH